MPASLLPDPVLDENSCAANGSAPAAMRMQVIHAAAAVSKLLDICILPFGGVKPEPVLDENSRAANGSAPAGSKHGSNTSAS